MSSSMNEQLLFSILEHLGELNSDSIDDESLQMARMCLSECVQLDVTNPEQKARLSLRSQFSLPMIFAAGVQALQPFGKFVTLLKSKGFFADAPEGSAAYAQRLAQAKAKFDAKFGGSSKAAAAAPAQQPGMSAADRKAAALSLKGEGNKLLGEGDHAGAEAKYTQAIALDDSNAVFFANRAAARITLNKLEDAVTDCKAATKCDPNYAKAYYRQGQALFKLGRHAEAVQAYKNGLARTNDAGMQASMKEALAEAELEDAAAETAASMQDDDDDNSSSSSSNDAAAAALGGMGGMDFASLLSNPAIAGLASQLGAAMGGGGASGGDGNNNNAGGSGAAGSGNPMADMMGGMDFGALLGNPGVQNMMAQMMGGGGGPGGANPMADMMSSLMGGMGGAGNDAVMGEAEPDAAEASDDDGDDDVAEAAAPASMLESILNSPDVIALKESDPEMRAVFDDVAQNGESALFKYMGNPSVMAKAQPLLGKLMASMMGGGM